MSYQSSSRMTQEKLLSIHSLWIRKFGDFDISGSQVRRGLNFLGFLPLKSSAFVAMVHHHLPIFNMRTEPSCSPSQIFFSLAF